MTETMMRDRAARLQIEIEALCDQASRLGFSIEIGRKTGDGRARFASYDLSLKRAELARSDHR